MIVHERSGSSIPSLSTPPITPQTRTASAISDGCIPAVWFSHPVSFAIRSSHPPEQDIASACKHFGMTVSPRASPNAHLSFGSRSSGLLPKTESAPSERNRSDSLLDPGLYQVACWQPLPRLENERRNLQREFQW